MAQSESGFTALRHPRQLHDDHLSARSLTSARQPHHSFVRHFETRFLQFHLFHKTTSIESKSTDPHFPSNSSKPLKSQKLQTTQNAAIMIGAFDGLVRRGIEAQQHVFVTKLHVGSSTGPDDDAVHLPYWGLALMISTIALAAFKIFQVCVLTVDTFHTLLAIFRLPICI